MARVLQRPVESKLSAASAASCLGDNLPRGDVLCGFRLDFIGTIEDEHTVRRDTLRGLARDWVLQFVTQEERFRIEEFVDDGNDAWTFALGAESERGDD